MGGLAMGGKRIKREHVQTMVDTFLVNTGLSSIPYYICGSYRRGRADCGDIEIVFQIESHDEMLFYAKKKIIESFGCTLDGKPKMQGLWGGVQFDLFISGTEGLGAMLMHATGSWLFNKKMRTKAMTLGLKLNQYGLWRGSEPVVLGTEVDIMKYLINDYIKPEDRDI